MIFTIVDNKFNWNNSVQKHRINMLPRRIIVAYPRETHLCKFSWRHLISIAKPTILQLLICLVDYVLVLAHYMPY